MDPVGTNILTGYQPAEPQRGVMKHLTMDQLDSELKDVRLRGESCDTFIKDAEKELKKRDSRARMFVKLTDGAGNAVKPIAIGSLVAFGFNPLYGALGLMGSIATLAAAFVFRDHYLKNENIKLLEAHKDLTSLQNLRRQIEQEKAPMEKMQKELEWVKKASEVAEDLGRHDSGRIAVDDDFLVIGGMKLQRRKEEPAVN